jgi:ribosomal protein S18 acetylase RimI-like enzyme
MTRRPATDADFEALWHLHVETMKAYVAATYGWDDAVQARMFREDWARRRDSEVLEDAGAVVANWRIERRPAEHFLAFIEVAAARQGQGVGTGVVETLLALAREAGVPATLTVMKANPRARRLYERLGFVVKGQTPTHWRMLLEAGRAP